jgi:protein-S-isoprenylcysteine O-methyltransferase Ste14
MSNTELLRILGYVWAAFGAHWMSFNVLRHGPDVPDGGPRRWKFVFLAVTLIAIFVERYRIPPALLLVLAMVWTALGLRWGAPSKAAHSAEFKWYRLLRLLILAAVFALLFWRATAIGVLGKRVVPEDPFLGAVGFFAAVAGMAVASWSRIALGKYWSDKVIVQTEHRLIRTGPYSCMRHPLYSGVLLAVLGTALVVGEWRGLVSFTVLLVNYAIKAKREERILSERFGQEFDCHLQRTGFLLPRFGRSLPTIDVG